MPPAADLPLRYTTPPEWATTVLARPLELLNDHAHLEKKAAANALELLNRWPEPNPPENWVSAMTAIARDEVEHLAVVSRLLARRGGGLTRQHNNPYASELHKLVRRGRGTEELVDRLMISALIEARSCERFHLLGEALDEVAGGTAPSLPPPVLRGRAGEGAKREAAHLVGETASGKSPLPNPPPGYRGREPDAELRKLYRGLWASEHGHYRTFIQLAEQVLPAEQVQTRWDQMLDAEAKLIARQAPGPRMHSGV